MRRYLRHPSDVPIRYHLGEVVANRHDYLLNIGQGGLCFTSNRALPVGARIQIEIPIAEPAFRAEGIVAWSHARDGDFETGVRFAGAETEYNLRMVEQLCQIEHYRREVREREGREISSEEAALEWIRQYAADFPR